jgi:hypothetical protein
MVVLLAYSVRGLRGPPSWERLLAAAALAGVVAGLIGGFAFDLFSLAGSADLFWIVAAFAVVLAERRGPPSRPSWSRWRLAAVVVGIIAGVVVGRVVPTHADVVTPFDAMPLGFVVDSPSSGTYAGNFWRNTACDVAKATKLPHGVNVECQDKFQAPGFGQLRVDAPSLAQARVGMQRVTSALQEYAFGIHFHPSSEEVGRPTWARTAPIWAGVGALLIALFLPLPVRRNDDDERRDRDVASGDLGPNESATIDR